MDSSEDLYFIDSIEASNAVVKTTPGWIMTIVSMTIAQNPRTQNVICLKDCRIYHYNWFANICHQNNDSEAQ